MNQILVWPLSDTLKIIFSSSSADLATITCCDALVIELQHQDQVHIIVSDIKGCDLAQLKDLLSCLMAKEQRSIQFKDSLYLSMDAYDHLLLEIREQGLPFCYQMISVEMVQSWIAQLDLLHVLMEENEHEKKSRNQGCC